MRLLSMRWPATYTLPIRPCITLLLWWCVWWNASRSQALEDTHAVEDAFSDLHRRFEKTKSLVISLKKVMRRWRTPYTTAAHHSLDPRGRTYWVPSIHCKLNLIPETAEAPTANIISEANPASSVFFSCPSSVFFLCLSTLWDAGPIVLRGVRTTRNITGS